MTAAFPSNPNPGDTYVYNSVTFTFDGEKWTAAVQGGGGSMTDVEVKDAYERNADTNAFTDAEQTKLAGVETGATADQTGAEIKALYEAEADTNAFDDADYNKLLGIEAGATADQTGAEIKSLYEAEADTNAFTDADHTKLDGIEAGAQVNTVTSVNGQTGAVTVTTGSNLWNESGSDINYTAGKVSIGTTATDQDLNLSGNFQAAGKIIAGDSLGHANITSILDTATSTGVAGFRPFNLIDTSALVKIARVHDTYGSGFDLQQWDAAVTALTSRVNITAEGGNLKFNNLIEGGNVSFLGFPAGGSASTAVATFTPDGRLGMGTDSPKTTLHLDGTVLAETIAYGNNQDEAYLIAGTAGWTGATDNWNTFGFQHRLKSDAGGTPRVTIDTENGEMFSLGNSGRTTIGGPITVIDSNKSISAPIAGDGTDSSSNTSLLMPMDSQLSVFGNGYIRTLLRHISSGDIQIGQGATGLIGGINLLPGSSGLAKVNGSEILNRTSFFGMPALDVRQSAQVTGSDGSNDFMPDPIDSFHDKKLNTLFVYDTTPAGATWAGVLSVKGWTSGYAMWQLAGPANATVVDENLYVRSGDETTWNSWRTIVDSGNTHEIETLGRRVWRMSGGGGATNGYWAKVCTVDTGTTQYSDRTIIFAMTNQATSTMSSCIVSVFFRSNATSTNNTMEVEIISKNGNSAAIADDSFKMISSGWGTDMELWFQNSSAYNGYAIYVLSEQHTGNNTITWHDLNGLQATEPADGTQASVRSAGSMVNGGNFTINEGRLRLHDAGDNYDVYADSAGNFNIRNQTDDRTDVVISNSGDMAIGTLTNSNYKLNVDGYINQDVIASTWYGSASSEVITGTSEIIQLLTAAYTPGTSYFQAVSGTTSGGIRVYKAGLYEVSYSIMFEATSGGTTSHNVGTAYLAIDGSNVGNYTQSYIATNGSSYGENTVSKTIVIQLAANDTVGVKVLRATSNTSMIVRPSYSTLTLKRLGN